jgi:DNA replication and repair protein RecF
MNADVYAPFAFAESERQLGIIEDLEKTAQRLYKDEYSSSFAFYELVYLPLTAVLNVQKMWIYTGMNHAYARMGSTVANTLAGRINDCIIEDRKLVDALHTIHKGKWYGMGLSEHIGLIPLVMISPSDTLLIEGGSEDRRKLMDVVISQYDRSYIDAMNRYNKALLQRNTMLKQEEEPDPEVLSLWEEQMAIEGERIFACRDAFVKALTPVFQRYYETISGNKEQVEMTYISHCQRGPLLEVIQRDRQKDRIMGFSLHGVHRDDLVFSLGGHPLKREGSQGQHKTFVIALKLAQFDFLKRTNNQTTPLLLLDDIFDKLDADRVEQIVKLVASDEFGQIFITDTNRDHLDQILSRTSHDYRIFHVENGNIHV